VGYYVLFCKLMLKYFFLFACSILAGCASVRSVPNPYSVLVAHDPTQHHLIDDFRARRMVNNVGGAWRVEAPAGGTLTTEFAREDAIKPSGTALKVTYNLPPGSEAVLVGELNGLDISQAKSFSFWLKVESDHSGAFSAELSNEKGQELTLPLAPYLKAGGGWQEVMISHELLRKLELFGLTYFRLILRAEEAMAGSFYLDQVVFSGDPHVTFRSLKDNLLDVQEGTEREERRMALAKLYDRLMLEGVAEDTWGYFRDLIDRRSHLPIDHIQIDRRPHIGDYASPTSIAMYLLACVAAEDLGFLGKTAAEERVAATLETVRGLSNWKGLFYNYYNTTNLQVTNRFVSAVDNGWLAAALVVIRQAYPGLSDQATALLDQMDFSSLYDQDLGQFHVGFDGDKGLLSEHHHGLLSSETRVLSYVAIGKGDVEERHWFRMYRTLPKEWDWQSQVPRGEKTVLLGQPLFQGYYVYEGIPIVPSWGGGLFEFLMPTLLMDEARLAPKGLGANNQNAVRAHMHYALAERGYPVWGLSPCAVARGPRGSYKEYGVPGVAAKGYEDEGVVTPHVSFLALAVAPREAIRNIRKLIRDFSAYGPYGLYDSVEVRRGQVCYQYLSLDQGMTLVALDNYLKGGAIRNRFHHDPIGERAEPFLAVEEFYPGFPET